MNYYRPISCCNLIYKCISSILASRIKAILSSLINKAQSAFVPGRHISDNILLAQELLRNFTGQIQKLGVHWRWTYLRHMTQSDGPSSRHCFTNSGSLQDSLDGFMSVSHPQSFQWISMVNLRDFLEAHEAWGKVIPSPPTFLSS